VTMYKNLAWPWNLNVQYSGVPLVQIPVDQVKWLIHAIGMMT